MIIIVSNEVLIIAKTYGDLLKEVLDVDSIYLFGSCVLRTASYSEIDIAVVSKDFTNDIILERLKLMRLRRQVDTRIEPHPINLKDFTSNNLFAVSIMETGIKIS